MTDVNFVHFKDVDPEDWLPVVNEQDLRKHLIHHENFTSSSIREWINDKLEIDSLVGCRIRAIYIDGSLAGWCGIQPDDNNFELAIVLSQQFWGAGIPIFKALMLWVKELGHQEVVFHLLDSRPEYKSLINLSSRICKTQLLGRCFTSYYISVNDWRSK